MNNTEEPKLNEATKRFSNMTMEMWKQLINARPRELPEYKSLKWLANNFEEIEDPKDDIDKMNNLIHYYCDTGADKIAKMQQLIEWLEPKIRTIHLITPEEMMELERMVQEIYYNK